MTVTTNASGQPTVNFATGSQIGQVVNQIAISRACSSSASDVEAKENEIKLKLAGLMTAVGSSNPIDPSDASKGNSTLVSYNYGGTPGVMPGNTPQIGTFVVQGNVGSGPSNSSSRLEVKIPITGATSPPPNGSAPGLWLKKGGINDGTSYETPSTTLSNNGSRFAGDVHFSNCDGQLSSTYIDAVKAQRIVNNTTNTAKATDLGFPTLPRQPGTTQNITSATTLNGTGQTPENNVYHYSIQKNSPTLAVTVSPPSGTSIYVYNDLGNITGSDVTVPRNGDVQSSDGKYRYKVGDITGNSSVLVNASLDPDTQSQSGASQGVIFYLTGDINLNGNNAVSNTCSSNPTDPQAVACSNKFQIYGYKTNGQICLRGNADTYAHILAPDYNLGKTGNGIFNGLMIGKSWGKIQNCGSNNGAVAVKQVGTWGDMPVELRPTNLNPQIGAINAYREIESVN
jgi:hypothetical protein